jgi:hypothetical protein
VLGGRRGAEILNHKPQLLPDPRTFLAPHFEEQATELNSATRAAYLLLVGLLLFLEN